MVKHCVFWKFVECKDIHGRPFSSRIPFIVSKQYRGTLLTRILNMQKKQAISFDEAINLVAEKQKEAYAAGNIGQGPGQYSWYSNNFVEWISSLGYHIELTGEEFELYWSVEPTA